MPSFSEPKQTHASDLLAAQDLAKTCVNATIAEKTSVFITEPIQASGIDVSSIAIRTDIFSFILACFRWVDLLSFPLWARLLHLFREDDELFSMQDWFLSNCQMRRAPEKTSQGIGPWWRRGWKGQATDTGSTQVTEKDLRKEGSVGL